jgi:hypothetical protein
VHVLGRGRPREPAGNVDRQGLVADQHPRP